MNALFRISALCLLAISVQAHARATAVRCDGCSESKMSTKAAQVASKGEVFVFNHVGPMVMKFEIQQEEMPGSPYSWVTYAVPKNVPPGLRNAFEDYVDARNVIIDQGLIDLPPDFRIRSVAGAFLDPAFTASLIEDELKRMAEMDQLQVSLGAIITYLIRDSVPVPRINGILKTIKITVRFPDGSTQDYELYVASDAITGEAQTEVREAGNARLHDGSPAPTSAYSLAEHTFTNRAGSFNEWLHWAHELNAHVSGSGTTMTCKVQGSEIQCIVTRK